MVLSIATLYQTRQVKPGHIQANAGPNGRHGIDPKIVKSVHGHMSRLVVRGLLTFGGITVLAVGIIGACGVLPIGTIGSSVMIGVGGYITLDSLVAFIIEARRGSKGRRFHTLLAQSSGSAIICQTSKNGKRKVLNLKRVTPKRSWHRAQWKIIEVKESELGNQPTIYDTNFFEKSTGSPKGGNKGD